MDRLTSVLKKEEKVFSDLFQSITMTCLSFVVVVVVVFWVESLNFIFVLFCLVFLSELLQFGWLIYSLLLLIKHR